MELDSRLPIIAKNKNHNRMFESAMSPTSVSEQLRVLLLFLNRTNSNKMKNNRQYHGVQLSKKESELINFLQTGSNDWIKAFYIYRNRSKMKMAGDTRKQSSWFNSTLRRLQAKDLCMNIPFIWNGIQWMNPGIEASKANLVIEESANIQREIITAKPII